MSTEPKPSTAAELGLMSGFPPSPDRLVRHDNQLLEPYNRWSFQNELKLNYTADVWLDRREKSEAGCVGKI